MNPRADAKSQETRWQIWIDRGGTFTDVVARSPDGARSRAGGNNGAETTTAPRVWNVFKF